MKKHITYFDTKKLEKAVDAVAGTPEYTKYNMQVEYRRDGRWKFIGWGIPHSNCENEIMDIKRTKTGYYIMKPSLFDGTMERFQLDDNVIELLGLEQ